MPAPPDRPDRDDPPARPERREIDDSLIRERAAAFGFDLTDEEVAEYVDSARAVAAEFRSLSGSDDDPDQNWSSDPDQDRSIDGPEDVRAGDDPYNAFRYRFSHQTSDGSAGEGPLSDLRVGIKDMICVAGVPLSLGAKSVSYTPEYDATVVRRLRRSGATLVGTTNMDAFAGFPTGETCAHGAVRNPAAEGYVPGGSSAGSGAAVAAGLADVALGTDTAGSVRIPASFCGVVGFKPTFGLVPRYGVGLLSPSVDHVGALADTVENASRTVAAMAGPDPRDPSTYTTRRDPLGGEAPELGDLTLGIVTESLDPAEPGVQAAVEDSVESLERAGATVERVSIPPFARAGKALSGITRPELAAYLEDAGVTYGTGAGYGHDWSAFVASLRDSGAYGDHDGWRERLVVHSALRRAGEGELYVNAQTARGRFVAAMQDALAEYDALVTPTTPMPAPGVGEMHDEADLQAVVANTGPLNLSGHPAISVPCGSVDGRPVGLQVVGDWHDESTVTTVAAAVERGSV